MTGGKGLSEEERAVRNQYERNLVATLKPGFAWNPLLTLPRNIPCPCGGGKKFKHCHLPNMPRAIPEKLATEWAKELKKVDATQVKFTEDEKN